MNSKAKLCNLPDRSPSPPPKRLRGGGEQYYDEDDLGPPQDFYDEDMIEEIEEDYNNFNNENQSSNLSWTDQTDTAIHFSQLSSQQLQRWSRKPLPKDYDNQRDIHFQWLDIDMTHELSPLSKNPNSSRKQVVGAQIGPVPVIRIYGVTEDGHSITTFLHGYTPYGYFALPEGYSLDFDDKDSSKTKDVVLGNIRQKLNELLRQAKATSRGGDKNNKGGDLVQGVQYVDDKKSIMGYNTAHTKFLRVYVQMPTLVPTLKRIMEEGVVLPHIVKESSENKRNDVSVWEDTGGQSYQPFECNVPFVLRFMIDEDINGAGWITLPKNTYQIRTEKDGNKSTHCQVRNLHQCIYRTSTFDLSLTFLRLD